MAIIAIAIVWEQMTLDDWVFDDTSARLKGQAEEANGQIQKDFGQTERKV